MFNVDVNDPYVLQLSESLVDEIVGAVGLPKTRFLHQVTWRLTEGVTSRLARIGVQFERLIEEKGLPKASEWVLSLFCNPVNTYFEQEIPKAKDGPLLVAANHPGAYDALIYFSLIDRQDIKWISTEIPFLRLLPRTSERIFYAPRNNISDRMVVLRNMIQHLRNGGAMVYFAAGHRDPDPAVFPGAEKMIDNWLNVFNMFYKYVPDLKILPVIGSGIVTEHWAHHPLTRLRRKQIDKHRLAEFGQVITQLIYPGKLMITPSVSFGTAVSHEDLLRSGMDADFQSAIISRTKALLHRHAERFNCSYV